VVVALWASSVFAAVPSDFGPPPRGHWAADATGKLSSATLAQLDAIGDELDGSGVGQLGILVVATTSGMVPRTFATQVFNAWGVGHALANDGVLLFVAVGDRKSEIVLGHGSKVTSSMTDVVTRDDLVANFKRGQTDAGLLAAARSLSKLLHDHPGSGLGASADDNHGLGPNHFTQASSPAVADALTPFVLGEARFPETSPRSWVVDPQNLLSASDRAHLTVAVSDVYSANTGRIFYLVVKRTEASPDLPRLGAALARQVGPLAKTPVAVIAWDLGGESLSVTLPPDHVANLHDRQALSKLQNQLSERIGANRVDGLSEAGHSVGEVLAHRLPQRSTEEVLSEGLAQHQTGLLVGTAFTGFGGLFGLRLWNRRRRRTCENCHEPRELLSEDEEDVHLSAAEQAEERVGSVDYDVWWCGRCQDVLVLDYSAIFSSYSSCPRCSRRTRSSTSSTEVYATEYSTGLVRVDETCASCDYRNSYTRTTSQLPSSSSSSSSYDSSSSSSSSSSDSSSFGGGSSDGGGSSGSW
jgi:uncharacterized protein